MRRLLKHTGAQAKSPLQVSVRPVMLLRSTDLTGTNAIDGVGIQTWTDSAPGITRNWEAPAVAQQPKYDSSSANRPNGLPVVQFTRADAPSFDTVQDTAFLRASPNATFFCVIRPTDNSTTRNLLTISQAASLPTLTTRFSFGFPSNNRMVIKGNADDASTANIEMSSLPQFNDFNNKWNVMIVRRSYVHNYAEMWANGRRVRADRIGNVSGGEACSDTNSGFARISGGTAEAFGGQVAEMAVWATFLRKADIFGLMKYAESRYAVPGVAV